MKKLIRFSILTGVFFCLFCGSVFAGSFNAPSNSILNNETGEIGVIRIKALDSNPRNFMNDFISSSINFEVGFDNKYIYFRRFNSDINGHIVSSAMSGIRVYGAITWDCVVFDIYTGLPLENRIISGKCEKNGSFDWPQQHYLINYDLYKNINLKSFLFWKALEKNSLHYVFDTSVPWTPLTPAEPIVPLIPLTPAIPIVPWTPLTPAIPIVPLTPLGPSTPADTPSDDLVMFSPSVISSVTDYLRSTIGTSVNAGNWIFFIIIGICVTLSIIRYFVGE